MTNISEGQRELLRRLGYTDETIDKLEKSEPKKKGKTFTPTPKKHLRIALCNFCNKTKVTYYVLDEVSFAAWEGHEVSKEEYFKTEGIKGKPSNIIVRYCDKCPELWNSLSETEKTRKFFAIISPDIGRRI